MTSETAERFRKFRYVDGIARLEHPQDLLHPLLLRQVRHLGGHGAATLPSVESDCQCLRFNFRNVTIRKSRCDWPFHRSRGRKHQTAQLRGRRAGDARRRDRPCRLRAKKLLEPPDLRPLLFPTGMYGLWNLMAGTNGFYLPYILRPVGDQSQAMSVALQAGSFALPRPGLRVHAVRRSRQPEAHVHGRRGPAELRAAALRPRPAQARRRDRLRGAARHRRRLQPAAVLPALERRDVPRAGGQRPGA